MWNLRSLKMSVMLVASGVALVAALPAKAQQVILTPGGTMFQPMVIPGTEIGSGQPAPAPIALDPSVPRYEILTPEQLKPGRIIFRGNPVEILASDDPRISEQMRSEQPPGGVWVFGEMMLPGYPMASYQPRTFFLAPPATTVAPAWDGIIRAGAKVPGVFGSADTVIVAGDDPRIPEGLWGMDLGDVYYWAIDARAMNPSLPMNLFSPRLYSRAGDSNMGFGIDVTKVRPEEVLTGIQTYKAYQKQLEDLRNPPPPTEAELARQKELQEFVEAGQRADYEKSQLIVSNPEIYSYNWQTWGKSVKDVMDAQGNVVMSKQAIMANRASSAQRTIDSYEKKPWVPISVTSESELFAQYEMLDFIPETIEQVKSAPYVRITNGTELIRSTGEAQWTVFPTTTASIAPVTSLSASPIAPAVSPAAIAISPTTRPAVTVQASQNPSADFAPTRSAPRNTVPEQLNRGVVDSPLSNSRIFPGMR